MSIGAGWVDGAWIDAGWDGNAWFSSAAPTLVGSISNKSVGSNTGNHTYELGLAFFSATSYSISPAIETGWTFNTSTGQLVIDTDANGVFGPYTVNGLNGSGNIDQNAFTVGVGQTGENVVQTCTSGIKKSIAFDPTDIERDY